MNAKELKTTLGLTQTKFRQLLAAGLPHARTARRGYEFDGDRVRAWLIETRRATERRMAASLTDVAVAIGVDVRTIHNWKSKGMPGVGPYDLDAIDQWRKNRGQGGRPDEDAASARRAEAQAQLMEAKLAEKQGKLVPIEDVRRLFVRHITEAGTILDQLSDQVAALLPAERPTAAEWPAIRAQVRTSAKRIIDAGRQALADALIDKKVAAKPEEQAACSS